MNEAQLQGRMARWAYARVSPADRGADFARDFLLSWERMIGNDQQRSRTVRDLIRAHNSVVQLSKDMHAVRDAGFELAERLLAEARKELTK